LSKGLIYKDFKGVGLYIVPKQSVTNLPTSDQTINIYAGTNEDAGFDIKETVSNIYSKLGNKTKNDNIVIKSVYQQEGIQYAKSINGIFSLRVNNTNKHFGNPFSSIESEIQKGL